MNPSSSSGAALLDQDVHLLSLQLLTKRQQDVFEFSQHHGAVLHLVVQLQALNEVLEVAGFLGLLDVAVDWVELFQLNELLSLSWRHPVCQSSSGWGSG